LPDEDRNMWINGSVESIISPLWVYQQDKKTKASALKNKLFKKRETEALTLKNKYFKKIENNLMIGTTIAK
jgi:hypothetical protein